MDGIKAVVRNGRIETEEPLDLPDGTQLLVLWSNEDAADEKLDESPEAVEAWGKWHESVQPLEK